MLSRTHVHCDADKGKPEEFSDPSDRATPPVRQAPPVHSVAPRSSLPLRQRPPASCSSSLYALLRGFRRAGGAPSRPADAREARRSRGLSSVSSRAGRAPPPLTSQAAQPASDRASNGRDQRLPTSRARQYQPACKRGGLSSHGSSRAGRASLARATRVRGATSARPTQHHLTHPVEPQSETPHTQPFLHVLEGAPDGSFHSPATRGRSRRAGRSGRGRGASRRKGDGGWPHRVKRGVWPRCLYPWGTCGYDGDALRAQGATWEKHVAHTPRRGVHVVAQARRSEAQTMRRASPRYQKMRLD